ncbi:hypothetical protein B0H17DRAFT_1334870 [Mycena rosella]|uniref:Uncharacterized protein n=1 Tax=Mycena rosella TaxID=1033263 RepID=A0AAD7D5F1_MYCRO|nr:hypothetical protein B0H17DRAFT_1334870 [Mycena rosella]
MCREEGRGSGSPDTSSPRHPSTGTCPTSWRRRRRRRAPHPTTTTDSRRDHGAKTKMCGRRGRLAVARCGTWSIRLSHAGLRADALRRGKRWLSSFRIGVDFGCQG